MPSNKYILFRSNISEDKSGVHGSIWNASDGSFLCHTFELPYRNNEKWVSQIPQGSYSVKLKWSPSKGRCFEVQGVHNRSNILIHVGNTASDTSGCILVGDDISSNGVVNSADAMGNLLRFLPNRFDLMIINQIEE